MAVDFGGNDISVIAGEALTDKQYYAVTQESDGKVDLGDSSGELVLGIVQSSGTIADGDVCRVRISGVSKVVISGAVEEGAELATGAAGKLAAATDGDYVCAIALEPSSADGDVVRARLVTYQKNPAA